MYILKVNKISQSTPDKFNFIVSLCISMVSLEDLYKTPFFFCIFIFFSSFFIVDYDIEYKSLGVSSKNIYTTVFKISI